jgi:orotidine-5'-phosphate decarboxylase
MRQRRSFLCVGLDTDIQKIPTQFLKTPDPVFEFNKVIIEQTADLCLGYKINTAFYEALGSKGWESMEKTVAYIGVDHFKIADAKRGDIGNTSDMYAKAFFEQMPFDAITVAPYMGVDSVAPFLQKHPDKWVILLVLTSNNSHQDFQTLVLKQTGEALYEYVLQQSQRWENADRLMYVVGATRLEHLASIRQNMPQAWLLIPGIGAQGGDLATVAQTTLHTNGGILVNVSRDILYPSDSKNFAEAVRNKALMYQQKMEQILQMVM